MKILISTEAVGGVLAYTAELAAALQAAGDEVVVATMGPRLRRAQREMLPGRVHESGFGLEWMEEPWDEVAAAGRWLLALEEEERPDVVHLCSYAHGSLPFRAPKVVVAHSCVLSWWRAVHGGEAPAEWDRYREEMDAGLRGADAVVAPTHAMLAEIERDHELHPTTAGVIHHGCAAAFSAAPEKRPLVLGSGRLGDPARNLAALDAAAAGLRWPAVVAGDLDGGRGPRHARSAGVSERDALAGLRRQASIYAAPALYEPFGLGILEAARDRCALVLGDIPSLRELWDGAALFVDPRDAGMLHSTLEGLIGDRPLREEMAERAQRRAADYAIGRTATAYRRLYRRLLGSGGSSYRIAARSMAARGVA
jgi:glycosyltransferase involved in cell wall biosynthesis